MMNLLTTLSLALTALLPLAAAQTDGQYTINPANVANTTRAYWCSNQQAQCPLICLQVANDASTNQNDCDPALLTYACICGNGLSPNISEYSQTLPFFLCQEWGNECVSNCGPTNNQCASDCRSLHPCGAQNPVRANTSTLTSATTMMASSSGAAGSAQASTTDGVYTGFGSGGASSTAGGATAPASASAVSGAQHLRVAALDVGRTFGVLGLLGALAGAFAVLL
ncbi:hypothetical protein LTR53_008063 [Teratosphaeriaceae sp. CCFEE 6253]|nr:hypothetical protein LTR53_008063 [Teratosphaeriaceae sp. CCFEE 6253]